MKDRISKLRSYMEQYQVDVCLIPMSDYHLSEYIGGYFKYIEYFTGFTGSAGTLVITLTRACFWTDGRYFIQAENQLQGSDIEIFQMGVKGVISVTEFLDSQLQEGSHLSFYGRLVSVNFVERLQKLLNERKVIIDYELDLPGMVWNKDQRPGMSREKIWELLPEYAGESFQSKCERIREVMKQKKAEIFIDTALDDIAWLFNMRGNDIAYNPVFLSYLVISSDKVFLFIQKDVLTHNSSVMNNPEIQIHEYEEFYEFIKEMPKNSRIWMDKNVTNYTIYSTLKENEIINDPNPVIPMKSIKNQTEIRNEYAAHKKDGTAVVKFLCWLEKNIGSNVTEIEAANVLEEYRKEQKNYLGQSFAPIVAYGTHGAIVHYEATAETSTVLENKSFVLVDTGGHYLEGTTDITRTIALGSLTLEQKRLYTAVLKGNLHLMDAKFLSGFTGANLDYLAREPLFRLGLDYRHGTGHGVGYLLNVHEGPNNFGFRGSGTVLEAGMITSDEPGVYLENEYGIRLENLILCVSDKKTEYGEFLKFDSLTLVPFDLNAILEEDLEPYDKKLLNAYHARVFSEIAPNLTQEEQKWLANATRQI